MQEFALDDNKLPPATMNMFCPKDLTNFIENGRLSCYVRFNDSQYLDFSQISKDSFTQQLYSSEGFIPDILEELDNVAADASEAYEQIPELNASENRPRSVAFVKTMIDAKFYMAPKTVTKETTVWAREVEYVPNFQSLKVIETRDDNGCIIRKAVQPYAKPIFFIENGGSDGFTAENTDFLRRYDAITNSELVVTDYQNLDPDNVYALITLPGRIIPTVDTRYRDSKLSEATASKIKNLMTADVVKGVVGFDKPAPKVGKKSVIDCSDPGLSDFRFTDLTSALDIQRLTISNMSLTTVSRDILYSAPSPVYPDLIALPLISKERCYGPWLSSAAGGDSRIRYSDIGGKVEFVKDENLAPWNYAGYQLMNEAGSLQAQFSNSLLLFSERGGFVYPEAPTGISLAKALQNGGPLVTSISVDISDSEISTTVKMDLYTSRFGKLQKQKELAIGEITRQRQKMIDETNANIRRGMGKNATSSNLTKMLLSTGAGAVLGLGKAIDTFYSELEKGVEPVSQLLLQAQQRSETLAEISSQPTQQDYNRSISVVNGAYSTSNSVMESASLFPNPDALKQQMESSVVVTPGHNLVPISLAANNTTLPVVPQNNAASIIHTRQMKTGGQ
jgi:hypothetical protein